MKLKKNYDRNGWNRESGDFWYDLTDGGYLNPLHFVSKKDAEKILEAVDTLTDFYNILPEYGEEESND